MPGYGPQQEPGAGLERDDFSSNRHLALSYAWSMIFSENRYPLFGIMLSRHAARRPPRHLDLHRRTSSGPLRVCRGAAYLGITAANECDTGVNLRRMEVGSRVALGYVTAGEVGCLPISQVLFLRRERCEELNSLN